MNDTTTAMPVLTGLREIAGDYAGVLSDVWGVVHNGLRPWPEACDALARLRAAGTPVVLISNAPRPAPTVAGQLDEIGVPRDAYDAIVTSGDVTLGELADRPGIAVYHLGPERDRPMFDGLDLSLVDEEAARLVVNSGLFRDDDETPDDYAGLLGRLAARGTPMICANPDIVVERGDRLVWCAGALAEMYETLGGSVLWAGKPHAPIYERALAALDRASAVPLARGSVLAIGDSLRTDVAGAHAMGLDVVFLAEGIHGQETGRGDDLDREVLQAMFRDAGLAPRAAMSRLVW